MKMGTEAEAVCQQSVSVIQYNKENGVVQEFDDVVSISPRSSNSVRGSDSVPADSSHLEIKLSEEYAEGIQESAVLPFTPNLRSGTFADIGPRRFMEDEHILIDDLSMHLGSLVRLPKPSAFYGIFDGHGGPEAAAFVRKNAMKFFFEDVSFPQMPEVDNIFKEEVENSLRKAFLLADLALADECSVSSSSGTTALTAFIFGRLLIVANAGDCRAVLCRKGEAIDMSQDHRPIYPIERRRVEELGGFVDDGYLNGVLSVSRALGDWDMKLPHGSASPLIAEPEVRQVILTEDDEFLIIGCDGIWDVISSQQAVNLVRRGLRRHDDLEQCARNLAMEALCRNTYDNLTVIIVCFSPVEQLEPSPRRQRRQRCFGLSPEAMCSLRNLLETGANR